MKEIPIKKYVIYVFGIAILLFILNKFYIRTWILENDVHEFFLIVTYSIPNLLEAIIGTLLLTGIILQVRLHFNKKFSSRKATHVYILASGIAAVYVISQELKFHNLVTAKCKKTETADNLLLKDKELKPNNEQPTHKTAHLQAPTHKPTLQLAKELFTCLRSVVKLYI